MIFNKYHSRQILWLFTVWSSTIINNNYRSIHFRFRSKRVNEQKISNSLLLFFPILFSFFILIVMKFCCVSEPKVAIDHFKLLVIFTNLTRFCFFKQQQKILRHRCCYHWRWSICFLSLMNAWRAIEKKSVQWFPYNVDHLLTDFLYIHRKRSLVYIYIYFFDFESISATGRWTLEQENNNQSNDENLKKEKLSLVVVTLMTIYSKTEHQFAFESNS